MDFSRSLSEVFEKGACLDRRAVRLLTPDGRVVVMDVVGEPWRENGDPAGATLLWLERSEGRLGVSFGALADLDRFQEVARTFMSNLFDPMVLLNMEGRIVHVNPPLLEALGWKRVELIGKPVAALFEQAPDKLGKAMLRFAKWMRTGQMKDRATVWLTPAGKEIAVTMSGSTIRGDSGELIGMVVVARDERQNALLHDLEKKNLELARANEELKRLDKMKDDILSLVGHELRAPLANILGYAEFISEWDMGQEEKQKFAKIIYQESHRLSRLVNDILDLSRMEAGRMPYVFAMDHLNRVIRAVAESLAGESDKKRIHLELELDEAIGPMDFDSDRIQQVLTNILHNAIKFSDPDKNIRIVSVRGPDGATVAVIDQGPGIEAQDAARVFNKFEQVDDVKHHSLGAGLGMPIAKQIIEDGHQGKLWFESEGLGKGSAFKFTIPERRLRS